uniref:Fringe-like glycosyltransferase domain-containing protein n=1 Tax=Aegilops tauschii subsp. strangulata TaxID=200361 RepID=A0A453IE94_AEGTS
MQPPKWKAVEGGGIGGDQRRRCVAASLSMLIAATLAFLAYVAFFPDDGAGGVYRWWSCQGCGGSLGEFPADEDAAADGPAAAAAGGRAPTTLSHIVFGIGASARTWDQRRGYAELWWRPEAMRGHVWLDEQPAGAWPAATCPPYRVSADASRFGNRASASRMARIVADSFLAVSTELANGTGADEAPRWFVMGDDDTVFFPDNLVAVLRKYDHEEMYYVGAPSESVERSSPRPSTAAWTATRSSTAAISACRPASASSASRSPASPGSTRWTSGATRTACWRPTRWRRWSRSTTWTTSSPSAPSATPRWPRSGRW